MLCISNCFGISGVLFVTQWDPGESSFYFSNVFPMFITVCEKLNKTSLKSLGFRCIPFFF